MNVWIIVSDHVLINLASVTAIDAVEAGTNDWRLRFFLAGGGGPFDSEESWTTLGDALQYAKDLVRDLRDLS